MKYLFLLRCCSGYFIDLASLLMVLGSVPEDLNRFPLSEYVCV